MYGSYIPPVFFKSNLLSDLDFEIHVTLCWERLLCSCIIKKFNNCEIHCESSLTLKGGVIVCYHDKHKNTKKQNRNLLPDGTDKLMNCKGLK